MNNVLVIGSLNMDLVAKTSRLPEKGETVLGDELLRIPGGKGANQAVSASKLGSKTWILGKVGTDNYGTALKKNLEKQGVDLNYLLEDAEAQTGCAVINVDREGNNTIVVIPGSNHRITSSDLDSANDLLASIDSALFQLEIPTETVFEAIRRMDKYEVNVILDPAPATNIPAGIFDKIDVLTPNLKEAKQLLDLNGSEKQDYEPQKIAKLLVDKGINIVILTLGEHGVFVKTEKEEFFVEGLNVKAIDTTAAGDCFTGAFAARFDGTNLQEAVEYANSAAALTTTKIGAQSSIPSYRDVENMYN